jgi:hypothetical protein
MQILLKTISRLILFKEIIVVYSENQMESTNTLCEHSAELGDVKVRVRVNVFITY